MKGDARLKVTRQGGGNCVGGSRRSLHSEAMSRISRSKKPGECQTSPALAFTVVPFRKKNANLPKALFAVANIVRRNGNSEASGWNSGEGRYSANDRCFRHVRRSFPTRSLRRTGPNQSFLFLLPPCLYYSSSRQGKFHRHRGIDAFRSRYPLRIPLSLSHFLSVAVYNVPEVWSADYEPAPPTSRDRKGRPTPELRRS